MLTAVRDAAKKATDGGALWEFLYDCGNTVVLRKYAVTTGKVFDCGCSKKQARLAEDEAHKGKQFGQLTALYPTGESVKGDALENSDALGNFITSNRTIPRQPL